MKFKSMSQGNRISRAAMTIAVLLLLLFGLRGCKKAGDVVAPQIVDVYPANGAIDVPINTNISITFSEPMDISSTETAFSTNPVTAGSFNWTDNIMTYGPATDLDSLTTYAVTISGDAQDLAGNALGPDYSFSFTTGTTAGQGSLYIYEDFETNLNNWFDLECPDRMYITDQIAHTGTHCLEMIFRQQDGEMGPGWMHRRFFPERAGTPTETEGVEEVYMRVYVRWSANWQWPVEGYGPHLFYLLAGDVDGLTTTELTVYLEFENGHPFTMICGAHQNIDYTTWPAAQDTIELERWHCVEIRAKMSDPGQSNGIIQVWLNDKLVIDVNNAYMRHSRIGLDGTTLSFHQMAIGPWYHGGIQSDDAMYVWIDELVISEHPIGCDTLQLSQLNHR